MSSADYLFSELIQIYKSIKEKIKIMQKITCSQNILQIDLIPFETF